VRGFRGDRYGMYTRTSTWQISLRRCLYSLVAGGDGVEAYTPGFDMRLFRSVWIAWGQS
jgi:hypothetical protein